MNANKELPLGAIFQAARAGWFFRSTQTAAGNADDTLVITSNPSDGKTNAV